MIAARPAPSDVRTAISCLRDAARAIRRLAMLKHAMASNTPTARYRMSSEVSTVPVRTSRKRHEHDRRVLVELVHRRETAADTIHITTSGVEVRVRLSTARRR